MPTVPFRALFKTLKYSPGYPGRFHDIKHARAWLTAFISHYQHRPHEGVAFYSPADVFEGRVEAILARRPAALDAHYAAFPERYPHGPPKAKRPPAVMAINPQDGLQTAASIATGAELISETPVQLGRETLVQ